MRQVATESRRPTSCVITRLWDTTSRRRPTGRKTNSEDAMKRSTLIVWLMGLGTALWLSSRVVDMHPTYAVAVGLAVLLFSAFAAGRPYRN